jgi:hypothetical protein
VEQVLTCAVWAGVAQSVKQFAVGSIVKVLYPSGTGLSSLLPHADSLWDLSGWYQVKQREVNLTNQLHLMPPVHLHAMLFTCRDNLTCLCLYFLL